MVGRSCPYKWSFAFAFFLLLFVISAMSEPLAAQQKTPTPIETIKKSVGFVFGSYQKAGVQKSTAGTGFFVFWPDQRLGPNRGFIYFVTAKHVLQDEEGNFLAEVVVRLNKLHYDPSSDALGFQLFTVPFRNSSAPRDNWYFHTDLEADVAVLPWAPNPEEIEYVRIGTDAFATRDFLKKEDVAETEELLFCGLFTQYFGAKRNYPILRKGTLALITDEKIRLREGGTPTEIYLGEVQTFGGNSGSPVFLRLGASRPNRPDIGQVRYELLGLVKGFIYEKQKFSVEETKTVEGEISQSNGIALIVPIDKVKEIIDSPELQALRDQLVKQNEQKVRELKP